MKDNKRKRYKNLKRDFKYINFKLVRKRNNKVQGKSYIVLVPQDMPFRALYNPKFQTRFSIIHIKTFYIRHKAIDLQF